MLEILKTNTLGLLCLLALFVSGCVETSMMFHGNKIPSVPVVALQEGGPHTETWQTFELIVNYDYTKDKDNIVISGQAVLSEHYQMNYGYLKELIVYFFFLDRDSRVLETVHLARAWTGSIDEHLTFSEDYNVPTGTTAISFGYTGATGSRSDRTSFYELPLSK